MRHATKRLVLRSIHLVLSIPIIGYIYQPASEAQQYAGVTRYFFVPTVLFSGYSMYAGFVFALVAVGLWLGAYHFSGFGAALLSQVAFFVARKIWLVVRARRATNPNVP